MYAKSLQSYLTVCDAMNSSLPGSSVRGIIQARVLEWVAMPSSKGSSQLRDRTSISYGSCTDRQVLYHECHQPGSSTDMIIPLLLVGTVSSRLLCGDVG